MWSMGGPVYWLDSTQANSELIYIYHDWDSDKITLLRFTYCSTKHTARS